MRVLILNGSPRPNGNTKQMLTAFCEGLESAGHERDVYDICKMNIHGCLACEYCHTKGNGQCIQKDDMQDIYQQLQEAEMLVIASPIYYHGLSGQLKCTIDRFYAAAYPNKPPKLKAVRILPDVISDLDVPGRFTAFDAETTGLDPDKDRIADALTGGRPLCRMLERSRNT